MSSVGWARFELARFTSPGLQPGTLTTQSSPCYNTAGRDSISGRLLGIEPRASNPQFNIFPLNYSRQYPLPDSNRHFLTKTAFKAVVSTISPSGRAMFLEPYMKVKIYPKADSNCQNSDPKSDTSTIPSFRQNSTAWRTSYRTRTDKLQILSLLCLPFHQRGNLPKIRGEKGDRTLTF